MSPEQQLHQSRIKAVAIDGIRQKKKLDITGAKIAVVGLDPDGFSIARHSASRGFETTGFDADEVKIAQLQDMSSEMSERTLSFTHDESELREADVFIICASPDQYGDPDLAAIENAATSVGKNLREGSLVIVASAVYPGTCEYSILPILEKTSGLARPGAGRARGDFFFAHAPIGPRDAKRVIGASDAESLSRAVALYHALGSDVLSTRTIKEAEAVRMFEDSLHDVALALVSEYSILFDRIGVDVVNVLEASGSDVISLSGISTPRASASAYYLARSGHQHEINAQLLTNARRIVEYMPIYAANALSELFREKNIQLKGSSIALLGLSDDAGSGSDDGIGFQIRNALVKKGVVVKAYDPFVAGAGLDLKQTLDGAQAVVIASGHSMFRDLGPRQFETFGISMVLDTRNMLDKEAFEGTSVTYRGIGRGA